jgi:AraC-like DNA-binding protein/CRP-like cAMP-binding protein
MSRSGLQNRIAAKPDGTYKNAWSLMRNYTDTQLVSDVNLLGAVSWRRWPRPEVIEPGDVLFHEGSPAREVIWILEGVIKLVGGEGETLGLRRGRSLLGPFIAGHPPYHQVSAIAVAPARAYRFAATDFRERLADPAFMESARPAMSHALQADLEDYTRGFLRDPEQRLAALLSNFVQETVATGECVQVALPRGIDMGDLAALLRVTSAEMTQLLVGWGQRGFARCEQEGFTFCWTSLNGVVRRNTATASSAAPLVQNDHVDPADHAEAPSENAAPLAESQAVRNRLPDARVIKALTLIDNSYSREDFGLGELGREMKLPVWHLSRLLKTATGMTFGQLRNAVRVERARVALLTTELSVKEIAAGVGYTHPTDLTRQFRSVHALSPIAYRARARSGASVGAPPPLRSAMPLIATAIRQ